MRLGILARFEPAELDKIQRLGFLCFEWVRFEESLCGTKNADWKSAAAVLGDDAKRRDIRVSAVAAWYRNPLDPKQTEYAGRVMLRAIEVCEFLKIRTIGAFAGALVDTRIDERGGGPVYDFAEKSIEVAARFWRPIVERAGDAGVRIAFEHCPQGPWHLPVAHWNLVGQPALWKPFFDAIGLENVGIEWDAGHLVCQLIDPLENIREFGERIFHVHAKDGYINKALLQRYGLCHPGVAEHRFPGLGQSNWAEIVHELLRAGYDSDLNIEGWHDPVYRDKLEETGLLIAKATLEPLIAGTE